MTTTTKNTTSPFLPLYSELAARILDVHCTKPRRVLDIGSGGGKISTATAKAFGADHLTMVDSEVKPTGPTDLPWKSYKLDVHKQKFVSKFKGKHNIILCMNALHELDVNIALKRMLQVIPPDGFLFLQETTYEGWQMRIKHAHKECEEDQQHLKADLENVQRQRMYFNEDTFRFWDEIFSKRVPGTVTQIRWQYSYFIVYSARK